MLYQLKLGEVVTTIPTIGEYASHVKIWLDSEATCPASRKPIIIMCMPSQVHKLMYETVKVVAVALLPGFSAGAWMLRLSKVLYVGFSAKNDTSTIMCTEHYYLSNSSLIFRLHGRRENSLVSIILSMHILSGKI